MSSSTASRPSTRRCRRPPDPVEHSAPGTEQPHRRSRVPARTAGVGRVSRSGAAGSVLPSCRSGSDEGIAICSLVFGWRVIRRKGCIEVPLTGAGSSSFSRRDSQFVSGVDFVSSARHELRSFQRLAIRTSLNLSQAARRTLPLRGQRSPRLNVIAFERADVHRLVVLRARDQQPLPRSWTSNAIQQCDPSALTSHRWATPSRDARSGCFSCRSTLRVERRDPPRTPSPGVRGVT